MPNSCGYLVLSSGTTAPFWSDLYHYLMGRPNSPEYKSSSYAQAYARLTLWLTHSFFAHFTAVTSRLMPPIHNSNKSPDEFLHTNFITYIQKGSA